MKKPPAYQGIDVSEGATPPDGQMAALMRTFDWSNHPFGSVDNWPRALKSAITFMLDAVFPAAMWLGPELRLFYNDAYAPILGPRHPGALGKPGREVWGELWGVIGPQLEQVMATGIGVSAVAQMLPMTRFGHEEETYWDYSFSPLSSDSGRVSGVFNEAHDVTASHLQRRHDGLLIALDAQLLATESIDVMIDAALRVIGEHLGAKRAGFAEVDEDASVFEIRRCWTAEGMPDVRGRYPLGTFGAITAELVEGRSVKIEDNLADPRTSDPATVAAYGRIALRAGIVAPIVDRGRYVGGLFVQDNTPRKWTGAQVALVEAATARLWAAIVRARSETAMRVSEERYRLVFEQAHDIIFTADLDQTITAANPAGAEALGYPAENIVGKSIADFVSSEGFAQTTAMLQQKLDKGGTTQHEVGVVDARGRAMRWENVSTLARDPEGRPIGLLSISRDVTERRAFEERQALLIRELNHRVKNTLSLVQGLAHQSFREGNDPVAAQGDFLSRLSALAAAHDLLSRDQWEGATLGEIVAGATAHAGGRIIANGPDVTVTPRSAVALVMALHELTTNAVKYGALSVTGGHVEIVWECNDRDDFAMMWRELGGPAVEVPERRGFGIKMIERALASDLGGTVRIEFAPEGLTCAIEAPVLCDAQGVDQ